MTDKDLSVFEALPPINTVDIGKFVATYQQAKAYSEQVVEGINGLYNVAGSLTADSGIRYSIGCSALHRPSDFANKALKTVRSRAWSHLLEKTGLRQYMDTEAMDAWRDKVEDGPELTQESIERSFQWLADNRGAMLVRSVCGLYKRLDKGYRTNERWSFGNKFIVNWGVEWNKPFRSFSLCNDDLLFDMDRLVSNTQGVPLPSPNMATANKIRDLMRDTREREYKATGYSVRWYQVGTMHIELDQEVIDPLNRLLAMGMPNALPG